MISALGVEEMPMKLSKILLSLAAFILISAFLTEPAWALSQFARKTGLNCQTCHTSFPRLTYFGEQFMRNGYQMPGTEDGDTTKTAIGDNLFIDKLQNLFGLRINITPVAAKAKKLIINGARKTQVGFGNPDWLQLFTGGSLFRNASIFIETEVKGSTIKNNWFRLGAHNFIGEQGVANLYVGKTSPMEWHAISGRLRMSPTKIQVISNYKSSGGSGGIGEDSVALAAAYPSISFYGYTGPILYSATISNGANVKDKNQEKNYYGTLRYDVQDGDFQGSAFTIWGMSGTDTTNSAVAQVKNSFWRASPALNIRYGDLDVIAGYFFGTDDNWTLTSVATKNDFQGGILQTGYMFTPKYYGLLQYDWIDSDDPIANFNMLTASAWYFVRENLKLGLIGRYDFRATKEHEAAISIRAMF